LRERELKNRSRSKEMDRRTFLKSAAMVTVAASLPMGALPILNRRAKASDLLDDPRVVVVRDAAANQGSQVSADIAQVMMDEAIRRYTGNNDLGEAYRSLFPGVNENSVIGIKVNCINSSVPTHPEMVQALTNGLQQMIIGGSPFPANNIIIWDRSTWELQNSGFTINTGSTGVRCFSSQYAGYSDIYLDCNGSQQHPSRILTDYCDYLVCFGVLKNHGTAGVTLTMKNHYGSIQNPGAMHGGYCDPFIPALNQQIRDELAVQETLFILDAVFGVTYGGPGGPANLIYDGLILSQDRVAVDAVGRDILDEAGCSTIGIATHVDTAAEPPYNLGTADLNSIERIEVQDPSQEVTDLSLTYNDPDIILNWTSPEYSGLFKVLRSADPAFSTYDEIAAINGETYTDAGILNSGERFFYRVVKTWG
jgi:uncharacterized protein (DUF362 family)